MNVGKGKLLICTSLFAALAVVSVWATNSATASFPISAEGKGKLAELSSSGPVTAAVGEAELTQGYELYRIDLGSPRFSKLVKIHVAFLNPADVGKVLNNPHAYIDVGIWYPDAGGSYTLSDGTGVSRDESPKASASMSPQVGDVILLPGRGSQHTLYILASIVVPKTDPKGKSDDGDEPMGGDDSKQEGKGKPNPHGQQTQLTELKFYVDVRM